MKNRKRLTYKDFKRYFGNNLQDKEKHDFEKRMMQDAFEEEAYDGLSGLSKEEMDQDIHELKKGINKRTRGKRRIVPVWFRYAASILILIAIGVGVLLMNTTSEEAFLVDEESVQEKVPPVKSDEKRRKSEQNASKLNKEEVPVSKQEKRQIPTPPPAPEEKEQIVIAEDEIAISESQVKKDITEDIAQPGIKKEKSENLEAVDALDMELALEDTKAEVLSVPEEETKEMAVAPEEKDKSGEKAKVVIRGANKMPERREAIPPFGMSKETYIEFITKKLDYSKFSDYPGEHEIILEFKVDKDGSLSSYQFRQLPDPVFAKEIKRAMQEFGNWNPRYEEGKRVSTKIELKFKIEVGE